MSGGIVDSTTLIKVENVGQTFDIGDEKVTALKDINFEIQANSFNIILGPSGSGKSTLLDILAGLQAPTSGKVIVEGSDIYSLPPDALAHYRANRVGFVHQTNHWIKSLNVIENLSVPLFFLGYPRKKAERLASLALDRVNMASYAKKSPLSLSGGEQQRLGMARALANDPLFIIADEPTGNLDSENGSHIMKLLLSCQTEFRRTVIVVTHNMEYISLADHLLRITDGSVQDIPKSSTQAEIAVLLKDVNARIKEQAELKKHANR